MTSAAILIAIVAIAAILLLPRVRDAELWRATVTPLASIIGSGFLVLGPILSKSYGVYAPLAMAALCLVAWFFGAAIRRNIETFAENPVRPFPEEQIDTASSAVLAFAYIISVAYYLNLFGGFGVSLTPFDTPFAAKMLTTLMFLVILVTGWTRGFTALERMEQVTVGLKLAIIAGLIVGLAIWFGGVATSGTVILEAPTVTGWSAITLIFGLIVTVQGFETSRYLTHHHAPETCIRSMKLAQIVATAIYLVYTALLVYSLRAPEGELTETSIIGMMKIVAVILPGLLVAAALAAQFSAAVADTAGSGGLIAELTANRIRPRIGYAVLVGLGLVLTWTLNIFEIISYASRAFAAYYACQSAIAAITAWRNPVGRKPRSVALWALTLLGIAITVLGRSAEGS